MRHFDYFIALSHFKNSLQKYHIQIRNMFSRSMLYISYDVKTYETVPRHLFGYTLLTQIKKIIKVEIQFKYGRKTIEIVNFRLYLLL